MWKVVLKFTTKIHNMPKDTVKKEVKEAKKRNEIRMVDVPDTLYKRIKSTAKKEHRSMGGEALHFLENNY